MVMIRDTCEGSKFMRSICCTRECEWHADEMACEDAGSDHEWR